MEFAGGTETWEVTPGFITHKGGAGVFVYEIPGASSGWMESAPAEHLAYVNKINDAEAKVDGAKKLARLAKAWKYYCNVPISSFYLEMRAAKYMSGEKYYNPIFDVCGFFEHLESISLSTMNDPAGVASRFYPCSSSTKEAEALSKVRSASTRARKALNAQLAGKEGEAFTWLDLVFGGRFPSRY